MATKEPPFTVVSRQDAFEIRDYAEQVAAEVTIGGPASASSRGFKLLAGYIFGSNKAGAKFAMTAPVLQALQPPPAGTETSNVGGSSAAPWDMRFIMPEGSRLADMPAPINPRVRLVTTPPSRQAVICFSGLAGDADVAARTAELSTLITVNGLTAIGPPRLARYDPPWTLWFLRRNEVMIEIAA